MPKRSWLRAIASPSSSTCTARQPAGDPCGARALQIGGLSPERPGMRLGYTRMVCAYSHPCRLYAYAHDSVQCRRRADHLPHRAGLRGAQPLLRESGLLHHRCELGCELPGAPALPARRSHPGRGARQAGLHGALGRSHQGAFQGRRAVHDALDLLSPAGLQARPGAQELAVAAAPDPLLHGGLQLSLQFGRSRGDALPVHQRPLATRPAGHGGRLRVQYPAHCHDAHQLLLDIHLYQGPAPARQDPSVRLGGRLPRAALPEPGGPRLLLDLQSGLLAGQERLLQAAQASAQGIRPARAGLLRGPRGVPAPVGPSRLAAPPAGRMRVRGAGGGFPLPPACPGCP